MRYLIDTNIIIDYLRGHKPVIKFVNKLLSKSGVEIYVLEITGKAGDLKRENQVDIPDALIASSCLLNNLTLLTRNTKHFQNILDLKIKSAL